MVIDEKLISYLEDLSFITLSVEERGRICADLESIIAGMELLSKLDTNGVDEQSLSQSLKMDLSDMNLLIPALRKDEVKPSFSRDKILENAPEANAESFVVPKTVE